MATCGLRNSDIPTSDNLTPQTTTQQDALEMVADGAGSSCPGSSVVADVESKAARFEKLDYRGLRVPIESSASNA